jgi:hypothetical protein
VGGLVDLLDLAEGFVFGDLLDLALLHTVGDLLDLDEGDLLDLVEGDLDAEGDLVAEGDLLDLKLAFAAFAAKPRLPLGGTHLQLFLEALAVGDLDGEGALLDLAEGDLLDLAEGDLDADGDLVAEGDLDDLLEGAGCEAACKSGNSSQSSSVNVFWEAAIRA